MRRSKGAELGRRRGTTSSPHYAKAFPAEAAEFKRRMAGDLPANWAEHAAEGHRGRQRQGRDHRHPQGLADRHQRPGPGAARVPRRFRRPDRLQPDQLDGLQARLRQGARQLHLLRRARVRHVAHHERHGAARRPAALRRHLPDVLGIRPQRPAHVGADEAARDLRLHPRLHRPGRRRPDPPAGRADRHAAHDPQHGSSGVPAIRSKPWSPGPQASRRSNGPSCLLCRARICPSRPATPRPIAEHRARAATCCPTPGSRQGHHHRHRLRSRAGHGGPGRAGRRRHPGRAWSRCRPPTSSTARTRPTRTACCPRACTRVAVEAGVTDGWYKYVGCDGTVIGIDRFGESAPAGELFKEFGFTVENVVKRRSKRVQ